MTDAASGSNVVASAPGKLVLAGEYAVLDGAPAVCMAVDRRARVTIAAGSGDHHNVTAPGFSSAVGEFRGENGACEWRVAAEEFKLVDDVWRTVAVAGAEPLSIVLDTSVFVDPASGVKLGIGSSAALTVALAAALCEVVVTDLDATSVAYAAHRRFQGGLGSGADIACCAAGGLIAYSMAGSDTRPLIWPEGLVYALLWSGAGSSTAAKLEHYGRQTSKPSRAALSHAAERIYGAWSGGDAGAILGEYRDYTRVLREFSIDHELGIFDAGHAELAAAAEDAGLVYKPCGAGGGDIGILLADGESAINRFVGDAAAQDFQALTIALDPRGVQVVRGAL